MNELAAEAPRRRHLRSVGTRLALATSFLVLMVSVGVYGVLTRQEQRSLLTAKTRAARMVSALFAEALAPALVFNDQEGVRESLAYLKSNPEVQQAVVFALDDHGHVSSKLGELARTGREPALPAPNPRALADLPASPDHLDLGELIHDAEKKPIGVAVLRFSLAQEQREFALLSRGILQVSAAVAGGLTLLLLLLARVSIIGPLRAVHVAANRLREGGSSQPLPSNLPLAAENEVGDLARVFVSMAEAIAGRERAIAAHNTELRLILESVGQGFLVLAADGSVTGQHSAVFTRWFGNVQLGRPLWEQLQAFDANYAEWMELVWSNIGAPGMPLALCLEQLPKRIVHAGQSFDVEYRPRRTDDGALVHMVVIVSDVSALVARERAEVEQRELAAMLTSMVHDRTGFLSFCDESTRLVAALVAPNSDGGVSTLEDLHTLKGNAGVFQLRSFADLCERIETRLQAEQGALRDDESAALSDYARRIRDVVARFAGHDAHDALSIARDDYEALASAISRRAPGDELSILLTRMTAEPAARIFERFATRLSVLAHTLGKCPIDVRVEVGPLRFPQVAFAPLWASLVHVLRNIADHALETPGERERAGKAAHAQVVISAGCTGGTLWIAFTDDGRGIDIDKIKARASALALSIESDDAALAALFAPGFTTAEHGNELSGQGVGLSAVASVVRELGGSVRMERRTPGAELRIALPASLLSGAADQKS